MHPKSNSKFEFCSIRQQGTEEDSVPLQISLRTSENLQVTRRCPTNRKQVQSQISLKSSQNVQVTLDAPHPFKMSLLTNRAKLYQDIMRMAYILPLLNIYMTKISFYPSNEDIYQRKLVLIAYSIFSLYRNTKIIHTIMMIWQNNFIESNYNWRRALRKILEEQRTYFHINEDIDSQSFLQKIRLLYPFAKEWYLYFHSLCFICHKKLCIFLPKRKKNWDDEYDMMGYNLGKYTGNNSAQKTVEIQKN